MEYNVIWIDDECDTRGKAFIQHCEKRHKIFISAYKTRKAGMDVLERNLKFWDAVILDAKAFNNSEIGEIADVDGLYEARDRLLELRQRRYIPFFILTRQADLLENKSFGKTVGGKFYKKDQIGQETLIADLKREVEKSPRYQLKVWYRPVLNRLYSLDIEAGESILNIFEAMHHPDEHPDFEPVDHYNKLRKILEWNFKEANKYGIIPDECMDIAADKVNLNQSCHYLSGSNCDHIHLRFGDESKKEHIVPKHIKDMMFQILYLGNIKSHTTKLSENDVDNLKKYLNDEVRDSRYLIFSLALQICEITMWLGRYIDEHQNIEENKSKCVKLENNDEEYMGVIEYHEGFHIGSLFSVNLKRTELLGQKVRIAKFSNNTNGKTKEIYPYFVHDKDIQLIEEPENGSK